MNCCYGGNKLSKRRQQNHFLPYRTGARSQLGREGNTSTGIQCERKWLFCECYTRMHSFKLSLCINPIKRSISFPISAELYRYLPIDVHVIIQSSRSVQPSFHSLSLSGREWSVQEPLKKLQLAAFESWNNKLLIGSHCVESDCANGSA